MQGMQMQMQMRLSYAVQLSVARRPTLTGRGSITYYSIAYHRIRSWTCLLLAAES
jgi:hypothetical protein